MIKQLQSLIHLSLILVALTLPSLTYAKQVLKNINPVEISMTDNFDDLQAFGHAVADKRIVLLDELTHGEQEVFALKSRLVQYLHQEKGFEVLLLESGIFDVESIWKNTGQAIKAQAAGNIFYMYSNNQTFKTLLDYIEVNRSKKTPLHLSGFDGRLSGNYSKNAVISQIKQASQRFLTTQQLKDFDWQKYSAMAAKILARDSKVPNKALQNDYLQQSYFLYQQLSDSKSDAKAFNSPKYFALLVKGILFIAEEMWGSRRHDENDLVMAENIDWLLKEVYPDKKVIIWGHYIHLNRLGAELNRYANVGTELQHSWAKDIYSVHLSGATGSYREFRDLTVKPLPELKVDSLERSLLNVLAKNSKKNALFIDSKHVNFDNTEKMSLFGHEYKTQIPVNDWQKYWDGMFFIQKVTASD